MPVKTYVLLDTLDADAPIYQTTSDKKRVQVKKMPFYRPTLRQTFYDENGVSHTIRYKSNAVDGEGRNILDQREQIDKLKIDGNAPFTTQERKDLLFRHGILTTNKLITQEYAETHPDFFGFKGTCDDSVAPKYKLLDESVDNKIRNSETKKRIKAASKVADMELPELQALLIRINGSFFETPNGKNEAEREAAKNECQNMLWDFIDDTEEGGLDAVLKSEAEETVDEKTTVLIGKLINADLLSFDAVEGTISKKRDGKWVTVRDMSNEYALEERKRLFSDFLNTDDGKFLKDDLEKDLLDSQTKKPGRPKGT